ncbi:hypothetical protein Cni_G26409 [Canna indica]|uniref:Uncharacterized protein n=1 Tax=Canna indica TaxID=4628 RepID=A0AAQ3QM11_9LILI|nr:hypothetical protein Cni_G26409 [Canna indica]
MQTDNADPFAGIDDIDILTAVEELQVICSPSGAEEGSNGGGGLGDGEEDSETDPESDLEYVPGDQSEDDDLELTQIRNELKAAKENKKEKLKNVKLHKDLETVIKEATLDKEKRRKRKSKEAFITTLDAREEGYQTDYPSSNDVCSIQEEGSDEEFEDANPTANLLEPQTNIATDHSPLVPSSEKPQHLQRGNKDNKEAKNFSALDIIMSSFESSLKH